MLSLVIPLVSTGSFIAFHWFQYAVLLLATRLRKHARIGSSWGLPGPVASALWPMACAQWPKPCGLCPGPRVRRRAHGPGRVIGPKGARLRPTTTNWGLPHLPYCNQNCSVLASLGVPLHSCCVLCPGSGICCTGSCLDRIGCRTGFTDRAFLALVLGPVSMLVAPISVVLGPVPVAMAIGMAIDSSTPLGATHGCGYVRQMQPPLRARDATAQELKGKARRREGRPFWTGRKNSQAQSRAARGPMGLATSQTARPAGAVRNSEPPKSLI